MQQIWAAVLPELPSKSLPACSLRGSLFLGGACCKLASFGLEMISPKCATHIKINCESALLPVVHHLPTVVASAARVAMGTSKRSLLWAGDACWGKDPL